MPYAPQDVGPYCPSYCDLGPELGAAQAIADRLKALHDTALLAVSKVGGCASLICAATWWPDGAPRCCTTRRCAAGRQQGGRVVVQDQDAWMRLGIHDIKQAGKPGGGPGDERMRWPSAR